MRLLVYEYLSSGALAGQEIPSSLRREGLAMLHALLADLSAIPHLQLEAIVDPNLRESLPSGLKWTAASGAEEEQMTLRQRFGEVDAVWLIAPESAGILEERTRWCEEAGVRVIGSTSKAVRLTSDKETLAQIWQLNDVPTPQCLNQPFFPSVLKPRDGAGSLATFLIHNPQDLQQAFDQAKREGWRGPMIQQPYIPGEPVSVAFLLGQKKRIVLPAGRQRLSQEGRFRYLGGEIPLAQEMQQRAIQLALRAIQAIPGLLGYVGVDLVLGLTDQVIEINPRLTTSYVGYRALARFNLAEAVLDCLGLIQSDQPESWASGSVSFSAAGPLLPPPTKPANIE